LIADPAASAWESKYVNGGIAMNMWTDNSMITTLGAFALAGLASIVY